MTHLYGHRWTATYGEQAAVNGDLTDCARTWESALHDLDGEALANGLRVCCSRVDPWPPTLPEFRALCLPVDVVAPLSDRLYKALPRPEISSERRAEMRDELQALVKPLRTPKGAAHVVPKVDFNSDPKRRAEIAREFEELGYSIGDVKQARAG